MSAKFYICRHCGNLVGMIHDSGVPMLCCGQKMEALVPNTVEASGEKHIPGAVNVPNEIIGSAGIPELPDKAQLILVYCRSGNRSKQAAEKLAKLGYTNIVEFGGIHDWTGETVSGAG